MGLLDGKVGIITGGSGGMGAAAAILLAKCGANLVLAARRADPLDGVVDLIKQAGGNAAACPVDVSREKDVERMVDTALEIFKRLDFIVCTAGIGVFGLVEDYSVSNWELVMDVNLKGPFLCAKAVLPIFKMQKSGHIINIASLAGTTGSANRAAYSASKAGLMKFSESLLQEVRAEGIKVSVLSPGSTNTGFGGSDKTKESWKLSPEDIAEAVLFLLTAQKNTLINDIQIRPLKTAKTR